MTLYRPNYRRARELKAELDQLYLDLENVRTQEEADEIRAAINEAQHAFFLTGVSSEYDL